MYQFTKKATAESFYSLRHRICQYLISAPTKMEKITVNRKYLSELMAVTARSINRILKDLRDDGIIKIEKSFVIILDWQALKVEAEITNF
jgi:CRP-like cAMP-binding protein